MDAPEDIVRGDHLGGVCGVFGGGISYASEMESYCGSPLFGGGGVFCVWI